MKLVDDHTHGLIDIPEGFTLSGSLRDGAERAQRRAKGVITAINRLYHDFKVVGFDFG